MNNFAARTIVAAALLAGVASVHGQVLAPIAFTFDTTAGEQLNDVGLPADFNETLDSPLNGFYISLQGDDPDDSTVGLPDDGTIVSASNTATKSATFQFAPYTEPNVLEGNGTLILTTPASYSNLAFLVDSLSSWKTSEPATFTLNFSDGSFDDTLSTVEIVPYWLGGAPATPGGSVALATDGAYDPNMGYLNDPPINFDEYDFVLSNEDAEKTLVSISVNANSGSLLTYAVSGTDPPLDLPEPPTWSLLATALVGLCLLRRVKAAIRS